MAKNKPKLVLSCNSLLGTVERFLKQKFQSFGSNPSPLNKILIAVSGTFLGIKGAVASPLPQLSHVENLTQIHERLNEFRT